MLCKFQRSLILLSFILLACAEKTTSGEEKGYIDVSGGKVWYEVVGGDKKGTPILLLHGGPGFSSEYLRPLAALADERPVIFYDQLGSGNSDKPNDTSLWKIERFVDELKIVRKHLQLDTLHLFGHSWGTMLAAEYLLNNNTGVKSVIFASPCLSTERWLNDANTLRGELPQSVQDTLAFHEQKGTTASVGYRSATDEFYKRYLSRKPYTEELKKSLNDLNPEVYNTMWGNNEFTATGNLKNFNRVDNLGKLTMPTLFTCGEFDEATPGTTAWYATKVKGSEFRIIKDAAHMTMNEQPQEYVEVIRNFLNQNN